MSTALLSRDNPLHSLTVSFFSLRLSVCLLGSHTQPQLGNITSRSPASLPHWHLAKHLAAAPSEPAPARLQGAATNTHTCTRKHMAVKKKKNEHQLYFAEQGRDISLIWPRFDVAPRTFDRIPI